MTFLMALVFSTALKKQGSITVHFYIVNAFLASEQGNVH
jgi:hypothetical protein